MQQRLVGQHLGVRARIAGSRASCSDNSSDTGWDIFSLNTQSRRAGRRRRPCFLHRRRNTRPAPPRHHSPSSGPTVSWIAAFALDTDAPVAQKPVRGRPRSAINSRSSGKQTSNPLSGDNASRRNQFQLAARTLAKVGPRPLLSLADVPSPKMQTHWADDLVGRRPMTQCRSRPD